METNIPDRCCPASTSVDVGVCSRRRKIKLLELEIIRLGEQKKCYTPKNMDDLPNDILSEIFLLCAEHCRQLYESSRWDDFDQRPYVWTRVALVCRRWHSIATGYTALWTWIVPIRAESTRVFLQRSGQRRLTIVHHRSDADTEGASSRYIDHDPTGFRAKHYLKHGTGRKPRIDGGFNDIFSQMSRIERLEVPGSTAPPYASPDACSAPVLRSLTIIINRQDDVGATPPMLTFFSKLTLPSLRAFGSWSDSHVIRRFLRPNLTSLSLSACRHGLTMNSLLSILPSLLALERLTVCNAQFLVSKDLKTVDQIPAPTTVVTLPSLQDLRIKDSGRAFGTIALARHLDLPVKTLCVRVDFGGPDPDTPAYDAGGHILTAMHFRDPGATYAAAIRCDRDTVSLELWDRGRQVLDGLIVENWPTPRLSLRICRSDYDDESFAHDDFNEAAATRCAASWIPSKLTRSLFTERDMSRDFWIATLNRLGNLQTLHVRGKGADHLPEALEVSSGKPVRCPNLRVLVLDQIHWAKRPSDVVQRPFCDPYKDFSVTPSPVSQAFAFALASRDVPGIDRLVIRQGVRIVEHDAQYVAHAGGVAKLEWDGETLEEADLRERGHVEFKGPFIDPSKVSKLAHRDIVVEATASPAVVRGTNRAAPLQDTRVPYFISSAGRAEWEAEQRAKAKAAEAQALHAKAANAKAAEAKATARHHTKDNSVIFEEPDDDDYWDIKPKPHLASLLHPDMDDRWPNGKQYRQYWTSMAS